MTDREVRFSARTAIEALRAGVPNSAGIRALGCDQPRVEAALNSQLDEIADGHAADGLLIRGDFGTGKSHCLGYLGEIALERRFVVSRVYVNKETPLHDPVKLFQGAADNIILPGRTGPAFGEIAGQIVFNSQSWRDFERWANSSAAALDPVFPASLLLFERFQADHEFRDHLIRFWAGGKLAVTAVRSRLRQISEPWAGGSARPRAFATQRFRFAARLMRAAGYSGWLLLIDEVELIGSYSLMQRAKSYIEIAQLMKHAGETGLSILPVFAITDDFAQAILEEKDDLNRVPRLMEGRAAFSGDDLRMAVAGMRVLAERGMPLRRPDLNTLEETRARVRLLYAVAFDWEPPVTSLVRREQTTSLRAYIRRWITEWDIRRLHPGEQVQLETTEWHTDYREDPDEPGVAVSSDESLLDDVLGGILQ
jgi:hypothetical protein